jgi:hypothetical protein
MQIVISISEKDYQLMKDGHIPFNVLDVIMNGTPLPNGHGRLVDADALEKKMCDREEELGDDRAMWESSAVSVALDMFAPTILDADRIESAYQQGYSDAMRDFRQSRK